MCKHNNRIGDNYGETCQDCGKVLSGYGYWGEGSANCIHRFLPIEIEGENHLQCAFCETIKAIDK